MVYRILILTLLFLNNKFFITKSGDGLYVIECGGEQNFIFYQDDSWFSNITSNSSGRSTNALAIKSTLATVPQDLKIYYRSWLSTSTEPSTWRELGDPIYFSGFDSSPTYGNHYVQYRMIDGTIRHIYRFSLGLSQKSDGTFF